MKTYALEGRKFGFSFIGLTQRASKLDKDIATQAGIFFLFKVFYPNDIELCARIVPGSKPRQLAERFQNFEPGECIYIDGDETLVRRFKPKRAKDFGGNAGAKEHRGWKYGQGL